jgi:hypothetical protein
MIGTTLGEIREHIESLATASGQFYLICGRTQNRPVPADGLRFADRPTAQAAVRATEQYRAALRQYDPQVPYYDVIACENGGGATLPPDANTKATGDGTTGEQLTESGAGARSVVEFCHTVAGVLFESIAESGHVALEDAIMDTYFQSAERIDNPDELCLRLLESIAVELDERLSPEKQATLLAAAAASLPAVVQAGSDPLDQALAQLRASGLLEAYQIEHPEVDFDSDKRSWVVTLKGYALGQTREQLVTLPIGVELFRRLSTASLRVRTLKQPEQTTPSWRLTVATDTTAESQNLVCAQGESQT